MNWQDDPDFDYERQLVEADKARRYSWFDILLAVLMGISLFGFAAAAYYLLLQIRT